MSKKRYETPATETNTPYLKLRRLLLFYSLAFTGLNAVAFALALEEDRPSVYLVILGILLIGFSAGSFFETGKQNVSWNRTVGVLIGYLFITVLLALRMPLYLTVTLAATEAAVLLVSSLLQIGFGSKKYRTLPENKGKELKKPRQP